MGKLKYGIVSPEKTREAYYMGTMTTSATLYAKSGRWVTKDTSANTFGLSAATSPQIDGYVDEVDEVCAAGVQYPILYDSELVVEMPYYNGTTVASSTLTDALLKAAIGEVKDIYVSTYQYANLGASTYKVIIVVGGDVKNNLIYTKRNLAPATAYV